MEHKQWAGAQHDSSNRTQVTNKQDKQLKGSAAMAHRIRQGVVLVGILAALSAAALFGSQAKPEPVASAVVRGSTAPIDGMPGYVDVNNVVVAPRGEHARIEGMPGYNEADALVAPHGRTSVIEGMPGFVNMNAAARLRGSTSLIEGMPGYAGQ